MTRERARSLPTRSSSNRRTSRSGNGSETLTDSLGTSRDAGASTTDSATTATMESAAPESATPTTTDAAASTTAESGAAGAVDGEGAVATLEMPASELSPEDAALREAELAAAEEGLATAESAGDALAAFYDAPPSAKARLQGGLGQSVGSAEETAASSFEEGLPPMPVRMGGEPMTEEVEPIATPAPISEGLETDTPAPADIPDLAGEEPAGSFDGNAGVSTGVDRAMSGEGPTPEALADALGSVSITDPQVVTSPGPPPGVPMTPGSETDPARIEAQQQRAAELAESSRAEATQAVIDGPGPEKAQLKELDEDRNLGEQARPQVEEVAAAEGADAFNALALPDDVTAQFDAAAHADMQAGVAEARQQVDEAESQRDLSRQEQLSEAETSRQALEEEADQTQRSQVQQAREEIQSERQATVESQEQAVADLEQEAESERGSQDEQIQARVLEDEQTVADSYSAAEREAEREVAAGEQKAEQEKASAEAEAENESWWDKATSFVKQAFAALTAAINAIFDAVRAAVQTVLDGVRELAKSVIDAAASFIRDAIAAYGELVKGLVDALLGDLFPGLAQALKDAIDTAVDAVSKLVDAVAEELKAGVDALVDAVQAGLNAILDAYQGALNFALGTLQAALTGDWGAVFERVLEAVLSLLGIDPQEFYAMIDKARDSLDSIIEDPGQFLNNLIDAVVLGFQNFADNFLTHLKAGIIGWLTGALGDIQLPEKWDIWGVLDIIRQVLGLTWEWVKERAARIIGEKNVERLEFLFQYITTLVTEGWSSLFQRVKDDLSDLKDLVMDQINEFLQISVIKAGITWLVSLFSPVGAIVKAIQTIWNVYTFLRDQLARLFQIVATIVDSLDRIVRGVLDQAAEKVESVLANLLPVAIDLVAKLIGITGVAAKVRDVISKVREKITAAVDHMLDKVAKLFKPKDGGAEAEGEEADAAAMGELEVGEAMKVADPAGPDHTLSIDVRADDAIVVLRSEPSPVQGWLTDFRARLPEVEEEKRADTEKLLDEATGILGRLDPAADEFVDDAQEASESGDAEKLEKLDDSGIEDTQRKLRDALGGLFEVFGLPPSVDIEKRVAEAHESVKEELRELLSEGAHEFHEKDWDTVKAALRNRPPFDKPLLKSHPFGKGVQDVVRTKLEAIRENEAKKDAEKRRPIPDTDEAIASFLANHLVRGVNAGSDGYANARADLQDAMFENYDTSGINSIQSLDAAIEFALDGLKSDDKPDPGLVAAVGGGNIDKFLMAVARGDATFPSLELPEGENLGTAWDKTYWGLQNNPNREWLKARFRKGGGQHEWLPTSYIGDVIDRAREESDPDRSVNAVRWVIFQTTFRSDTKILFFSPKGPHSRTVMGLRDPKPPHDMREGSEGIGEYKVLQGHVGAVYAPVGDSGYVEKVQSQTVGQGPWHDGLRAIFDRNKSEATAMTGIEKIMSEVSTYAEETLWEGDEHSEWGFEEYYETNMAKPDGKPVDRETLKERAESASGELRDIIETTTKAVEGAKLP